MPHSHLSVRRGLWSTKDDYSMAEARIAFTSYSPVLVPLPWVPWIYVMTADGTELKRLTD